MFDGVSVVLRKFRVLGQFCILSELGEFRVASANATPPADEDAYAFLVCSALSSWRHSFEDLMTAFGSEFQRADSAEEMKVAVATYMSSSAARMQQLADEIGSIDPSAVSGGKTIQQEILAALWSNIGGLQTAFTQVQALDTSDEEEMKAGLLEIVRDTQAAPLDDQLRLGAFGDRAFRHARGCDTVA